MELSKTQRKKNFNPRKWASKFLKDGGGMPIRSFVPDGEDRPGVKCTVCGDMKFADVYGFPDPTTFKCVSCEGE